MNLFDRVLKESHERWAKIEALTNDIKEHGTTLDKTTELLLLLAEHLKPVDPKVLQREVNTLVKSLIK